MASVKILQTFFFLGVLEATDLMQPQSPHRVLFELFINWEG